MLIPPKLVFPLQFLHQHLGEGIQVVRRVTLFRHPVVRWRADDLEDAIHADLETIRIPDDELADWFHTALQATFKDIGDVQREQRIAQKKRLAEIEAMQERLLNAYLAGTIDEATLAARQTQLRDESATVAATLATCDDLGPEDV
ncbi:MAG: hypothetical protein KDA90_24245, partial [Planctomycetaceae bacterium]|nr:hypothetical protein [Planctomycetaceae bacterium]